MLNQQPFDHVFLGATGAPVTPSGIGTCPWGDRLAWGYGKGYGESDLQAAFEACVQSGVNLFDTAEVYGSGRSERLLGRFARRTGRPVIIAKFLPFPWRLRRTSLLDALRKSLARLEVARVDLYQMHFPFPPVPIETWMDAMADVVKAGWVRAVGVSNYSSAQMRRAHAALARRGIPLASNQVKYSLLDRSPERNGLLRACRELNVTLRLRPDCTGTAPTGSLPLPTLLLAGADGAMIGSVYPEFSHLSGRYRNSARRQDPRPDCLELGNMQRCRAVPRREEFAADFESGRLGLGPERKRGVGAGSGGREIADLIQAWPAATSPL